MKKSFSGRRRFIRETATTIAGIAGLSAMPVQYIRGAAPAKPIIYDKPRIRFSVIGINHNHINSQVEAVKRGGGEFVSFYAKEPDLASSFSKLFPEAKQVKDLNEILNDRTVQLVVSAAIPDERAPIGIQVMKHGKDFMADKPGITDLKQLEEVKKVQKESKRIYSIMYSERLENGATIRAGELVKEGAIGKVVQTIGLGPHRMNPKSRPEWFFHPKRYGGIITDIASHQFDQFLFFTGSKNVQVVSSQVANVNHPDYPELQDFADVLLKGDTASGFIRVDWFTPDSLKTWGDTRLTILGTEGYIEVRKNIDIAGREGANHLFLVNNKETKYINCNDVPLTYGHQLVDDVLNRTETAMPQDHCFYAAELAIKAQQAARKIHFDK
ncbi:MAG TPA: Gfo/Idh/MocA family oxidoreductase [Flavitalea sp.]|nr:Gfo/Idh/MocA family oxidoreductase [Flavitalea sp.]